jgi:glycosyltransferase involved in cell wall biosynthesis
MDKKNYKIAIVGCQGLPARYGGYETLVEYLAQYKPSNVDVTVYCSSKIYKDDKPTTYKGVNLEYINLPSNGLASCVYDMYAIVKSVLKFDKILILGSSGGLIFPFYRLYRNKFVLNIGGIEWKRSKYNLFLQKFVRLLMKISVGSSGSLIADNIGIKDYIQEEYKRSDSVVIEYGGDQAQKVAITKAGIQKYPFLREKYSIAIARIQSDNNVELLLEAFKDKKLPLVYIGNWDVSKYAKQIRKQYSGYSNLILLDAIFDLEQLNMLRSNCFLYLHAHSAGGTNPSLVEAMHLNVPVFCYGNVFNKHVTENKTKYFTNVEELKKLVESVKEKDLSIIESKLNKIALEKYTWEIIAKKYYDFLKQ